MTTEQIDREEQNILAGLDPNKPLEIEEKYRIKLDNELPSVTPLEDKGTPRFLTVALVTGTICLSLAGFWMLVKPKPPTGGSPQILQKPRLPKKPKKRNRITELNLLYRINI